MTTKRVLSFAFAIISLLLSLFVYTTYLYQLGFPDGHLTDLDRATNTLGNIFIGVSVAISVCFFYLGWMASRKNISKILYILIVLYMIFVIITCCIHYYQSLYLDSGIGG